MIPLQITAHINNSLAVTDNFSPAIEGIIEYSIREKLGLLHPNPNNLEDIIPIDLPLKLHSKGFYHCSSPHYLVQKEFKTQFRKKVDYHDRHLKNAPKKIAGSEGQFKNYDLPLFQREVSRIDWFVVGIKDDIQESLNRIPNLGKKRSQGYGLVTSWEITEIAEDWSIWGNKHQLMRPIPIKFIENLSEHPLTKIAWKCPSWHPDNQALCWIPKGNVQKINTVQKVILKK